MFHSTRSGMATVSRAVHIDIIPRKELAQISSKKNALTCMHLPTALHAALQMGWIDPVCQVRLVELEDWIGIGDTLAVSQVGFRKEAYDRHQWELKCLLHLQRSGVLATGIAPSVQKTDLLLLQCDGYAFSRVQARLLLMFLVTTSFSPVANCATVDCVVRRLLRDKYSLSSRAGPPTIPKMIQLEIMHGPTHH